MSSLYAVSPVVDISESTPQDLTQSEEIREFFVDRGRKHGSALLLKGRDDYNARPRDADGRVLSTVSKGPTRDMTTETHNVHNHHVLTQKEQEMVDFHKPGRANIGAMLSSAKNTYALRPRTMSGLHVQTTVGRAPFSWAKERAEQRALERPQAPPTDYEARGALGASTIGLRKLEKDRRAQLSSHLEDESEKYKFRMKIRQNIIDRKLSHSADRGGQRFKSEPIGMATSPMTASAIDEENSASRNGKSSQSRGQQPQRGRTLARTLRSSYVKRDVRAASTGSVRGTSLDRHAAAAQRRQEQREQKQQRQWQWEQEKRLQVKQPRQPSPHSSFSSQVSTTSTDSATPERSNHLSSLRATSETHGSRSQLSRAAGRIQGAISSAFGSPKSMDAGSHWDDASPTGALESEEQEAGVVLSPYFSAYAHTEARTPTAKTPARTTSKAKTSSLQPSSTKRTGAKIMNSSPTSVSSTGSRSRKTSSNSSSTGNAHTGRSVTKSSTGETPSRGRSTGRTTASALRAEVITSGMKRPVVRRPIQAAGTEGARQNGSSPRRSRSANAQRSRQFPGSVKHKHSMTP